MALLAVRPDVIVEEHAKIGLMECHEGVHGE